MTRLRRGLRPHQLPRRRHGRFVRVTILTTCNRIEFLPMWTALRWQLLLHLHHLFYEEVIVLPPVLASSLVEGEDACRIHPLLALPLLRDVEQKLFVRSPHGWTLRVPAVVLQLQELVLRQYDLNMTVRVHHLFSILQRRFKLDKLTLLLKISVVGWKLPEFLSLAFSRAWNYREIKRWLRISVL